MKLEMVQCNGGRLQRIRKLLNYLADKDITRYRAIVKELGLRR